MGWEIEREELDKAEGVHRFVLIERGVLDRSGNPARHHFYIMLGTGTDGKSCPHCGQEVKTGLTLQKDGVLVHAEGEHNPRELVKAKIAELPEFHARMDAYAARHKAPIYKGGK